MAQDGVTVDIQFLAADAYLQNGVPVGMTDNYDIDSKPWGERTPRAEIATRAADAVAP
jgi:hypothetical protein